MHTCKLPLHRDLSFLSVFFSSLIINMFTASHLNNNTEFNISRPILNDLQQDDNEDDVITTERRRDWRTLTTSQIIIFVLFLFGLLFAILMYCKTCTRAAIARHTEHSDCRNEREDSLEIRPLHPCTIYEPSDRPPSYSEACSAPPLYESPFNRVSMLEPPPVYPETPKPSKRVSSTTIDEPFPITNHI